MASRTLMKLTHAITVLSLVCIPISLSFSSAQIVSAQDVECEDLSYADRVATPCGDRAPDGQAADTDCSDLNYSERIATPCNQSGSGAPFEGNDSDEPGSSAGPGDAANNDTVPLIAGVVALAAIGGVFFTAARRLGAEAIVFD